MIELHYTLVSDGTSDRALIPIINWLIRQNGYNDTLEGTHVDYRLFRPGFTGNHLADRILYALKYFPCDLLIILRDSEGKARNERIEEIIKALEILFNSNPSLPNVPVIPIRMTEAWLLFREDAIRYAAGNLSGVMEINLPELGTLEQIAQPKTTLHELILTASGLSMRRRRAFVPSRHIHRVTEYINDFSELRALSAFRDLENDIANMLRVQNWISNRNH